MKKMFMSSVVLIFLLQVSKEQQNKLPIYIGNSGTNSIFKIQMTVDIGLNQTIISSNDFNCTNSTGCSTTGVIYNISIYNKVIKYNQASLSINLINSINPGLLQVIYLFNDTEHLGSVLGLSSNSVFLTYYFSQNQLNNRNGTFSLNYLNKLQLGTFNTTNYTVLASESLLVSIKSRFPMNWTTTNARMCISNSVDNGFSNNTIIGIPSQEYQNWENFVKQTYTQEIDENYLDLIWSSVGGTFLTQMNYLVADFVNNNTVVLIRSVPTAQQSNINCDIYTGSLLLQRFDFHLLYTEQPTGFVYRFAFNSTNQPISLYEDDEIKENQTILIWVILAVIVVLILAIFLAYKFIHNRHIHATLDEGYMSMNVAPIELNEVHRSPAP